MDVNHIHSRVASPRGLINKIPYREHNYNIETQTHLTTHTRFNVVPLFLEYINSRDMIQSLFTILRLRIMRTKYMQDVSLKFTTQSTPSQLTLSKFESQITRNLDF